MLGLLSHVKKIKNGGEPLKGLKKRNNIINCILEGLLWLLTSGEKLEALELQ